MKKNLGIGCILLFLLGCGGRAPLQRAESVLFDVPYIQKTREYETLVVGVKKLSVPEIRELFCKATELLKNYHVYYVRIKNTATDHYFAHISGQTLPTRKDLSIFFDPYTTMHTIAHVVFMIPTGIGLGMVAPDPLTYFAGFLGINVGLHLAETQALGIPGYQEFEKHVLARDSDAQVVSAAVGPFAHNHYLVFTPQRDAHSLQLTLTLSARDKITRELVFDFSEQ